jgi:hypothetical protein
MERMEWVDGGVLARRYYCSPSANPSATTVAKQSYINPIRIRSLYWTTRGGETVDRNDGTVAGNRWDLSKHKGMLDVLIWTNRLDPFGIGFWIVPIDTRVAKDTGSLGCEFRDSQTQM